MTQADIDRNEIIEMAELAGVAFSSDEYPEIWQTYMHVGKKELEAFAKLVDAKATDKEREACANHVKHLRNGDDYGEFLAKAILARGEAQ